MSRLMFLGLHALAIEAMSRAALKAKPVMQTPLLTDDAPAESVTVPLRAASYANRQQRRAAERAVRKGRK